ncbi:hypothetical protein GCM10010431_54920 [Streptomyces kunmingensis]
MALPPPDVGRGRRGLARPAQDPSVRDLRGRHTRLNTGRSTTYRKGPREHTLETDKKKILRDLDGVQYRSADDAQQLPAALEAEKALLAAGVSFEGVDDGEVPWFVAAQALGPDGALAARIERLGQGMFALADTVQKLHSRGNPTVHDYAVPAPASLFQSGQRNSPADHPGGQ